MEPAAGGLSSQNTTCDLMNSGVMTSVFGSRGRRSVAYAEMNISPGQVLNLLTLSVERACQTSFHSGLWSVSLMSFSSIAHPTLEPSNPIF